MTSSARTEELRMVFHWIDGAPRHAGSDAMLISSPHDGAAVTRAPVGDASTVAVAIASAQRAFPAWRATPPLERSRLVAELGRRLRERRREFVDAEVRETGKPVAEMDVSLSTAADYFEFYGGVVRALFGQTICLGRDDHAFTTHEPFGVVGMITPWNGPLTQAARGIAAALSAGNTVLIKPSEFTPSTTVMLAQLASEVGVPPGVLSVVCGGAQAGAAITEHPDVRLVAFTGSVATGRTVARAAADRLVPVILELGGKSPNVVFADADLAGALTSALTICASSGQQCAALSRLLVHDDIYEEFVGRVAAGMRARIPGTNLAPLTTAAQFEKVRDYFRIARRDGARLLVGGDVAADTPPAGRYVQATVYADVTPAMRIFREEIFGPVLAVSRFETEQEAVALANDTAYGLVASVWTQDSARALRVADQIDAGQVIINGGRTGIETPFGGYKNSGVGREKGFEALLNYTQVKTTVVSTRSPSVPGHTDRGEIPPR